MTRQTFMTAAFATILAAALPSCNKDDVIDGPDEPENGIFRPATSQSSPYCDRVFEWTPAPGQFINDFTPEALSEPVTDQSEAARLALGRLDAGQFVSLGAFGGYIVVGFDHSITSSAGDYDFAVAANAFPERRHRRRRLKRTGHRLRHAGQQRQRAARRRLV